VDPTLRLPFLDEGGADESWRTSPAEPRDAASVILLRDGAFTGRGAVDLHLQVRHSRMPFAPSAAVFPGGGVDPLDDEPIELWDGPDRRAWSAILEVDAATAARVLTAAARELFEETGVLLAGSDDSTLTNTSGPGWEVDRLRVARHEASLATILRERGLTFRSGMLHPWSRWTTPAFESRRFRTWFFTAVLPAGQRARDVSGETSSVEWSSVRDVLARAGRGELRLLPPQICVCLELFGFSTAAEAIGAAREFEVVDPVVLSDADGSFLGLPRHLVALGRAVGTEMAS
jgi:8-oxo-dGTP pyrophosphatase MutT (NUDIX family)